ncbi:MAG TPA: prenyltransferase/squalene oxidase repeat-containing protein [Pseudomonadales bacterium]|nr:prenyltransferase/squalene oxidase repeat-containing protein [Pseudomonadales bacterium]
MTRLIVTRGMYPEALLRPTVDYIRSHQHGDGAVAWFDGGHVDPWDHVEAAMGLSIGGCRDEAEAAYAWLRRNQLPNGSWYASYRDGEVEDDTRAESNFVAYVATGIWHHYLITRDRTFLAASWPMVERAMAFVLSLQAPTGEIYWALDTRTGIDEDALVTGCASIYKSLECTINAAHELGEDPSRWIVARARLGGALRTRPERFDRTWESKARFSMDWFYPVLTGVVKDGEARARLRDRWDEFVEPGIGCRCVADQPWATVAESCELVLALLAAGEARQAADLFSWLHDRRADDGSYWTGYQFDEQVLWPMERPTWTAAAILLAADALARATPAARLFTTVCLPEPTQQTERLHQRDVLEKS